MNIYYYYEQSHTLILDEGTRFTTVDLPKTVSTEAVKAIINAIKQGRADDG